MILNDIISEIKHSKRFLILADEATSQNKVCAFIFIDRDGNVRENFMDFIPLIRVTGETIAAGKKQTMKKLRLNIANIRGRGYDRCTSMSSNAVNVRSIIKKDSPKVLYMHCSRSCLNTVAAKICKVTAIRNMLVTLT